MKNIPHDYYLKFTNTDVMEDVLQFHNKGNFTIHETVKNLTQLHPISLGDLENLTGNETQLYPDLDITFKKDIINPLDKKNPLYRNSSCGHFKNTKVSFSKLIELIRPLIKVKSDSHNRGYPSAGALYPVEVFCCSLNRKNNWPSNEKPIHLLSNSKTFEILQSDVNPKLLKDSILPPGHTIGSPSLALIYVIYMPKILFKYRYRGYRMAMMEVGSMYMLVDLSSKTLNLKSRQWSGFTDNMLCKSIGLNPTLFYPACVHFIGE